MKPTLPRLASRKASQPLQARLGPSNRADTTCKHRMSFLGLQVYIYPIPFYPGCIYVYGNVYLSISYLSVTCFIHPTPVRSHSQSFKVFSKVADRCRLQPPGTQHANGTMAAVSLAQLASQQVLQIGHCQGASLGAESSQPPFLSGICGQGCCR